MDEIVFDLRPGSSQWSSHPPDQYQPVNLGQCDNSYCSVDVMKEVAAYPLSPFDNTVVSRYWKRLPLKKRKNDKINYYQVTFLSDGKILVNVNV